MFCKKCGAQLNDNAKFCPKCGAQFENGAVAQSAQATPVADPFAQPVQAAPVAPVADLFAQPAQPAQPMVDPYATPVQGTQNWGPTMKAKKSGKGAKIAIISSIVGLVAVIALVIVLLFACGGSGASSIEDAIENYFEAVSEKDLDAVSDIVYPVVFSETFDPEIYEEDEFMQDLLDAVNPGDGNPKFGKLSITNKDKYTKAQLAKLNVSYEDDEEFIAITNAVSVSGKINIKVDGESHTYRLYATLVNADGSWYIKDIRVPSYTIDDSDY